MTTYTFNPPTAQQQYSWYDPSVWDVGAVPNDSNADVIFPVITRGGSLFFPNVSIGQATTVKSLSLTNTSLNVSNLTVVGSLTVLPSSQIDTTGTISAGSLTNQYLIAGSGQITVTGQLSNEHEISGSGLTLTAHDFINAGSIESGQGDVTINVTHSFGNLLGSTLTGGTYQAGTNSTFYFNVGAVITNDAANIILSGGDIASFDSVSSTFIPIETSLLSIDPTGSLSLTNGTYNWSNLTDNGLITIGANGTLNTPQIEVSGDLSFNTGVLATPQLNVDSSGHAEGAGTINGSIHNAGVIAAQVRLSGLLGGNGKLVINGSVVGTGHLEIGPAVVQGAGHSQVVTSTTLELNGSVSQDVVFDDNTGTLTLDDPAHFTGSIKPVTGGDRILIPGIDVHSITNSSYSGDAHGGTLTLQESGGGHLDIKFTGVFDSSSFTLQAGPQDLSTSPPSLVITGFTPPPLPSNSGNVDEWILKNGDGHWAASAGPGSHPAGSHVVAVADFNNDGFSDILWQNVNTGGVDLWKLQNGAWAGSVDLGTHPGGYQIAGAGDFNHDGTNDVLWFNATTGGTDIWELSNGQWAASVSPGNHPTGYQVAGIGDFNHDGTSDILWFNPTTGNVDEWNIVNGQWAGSNNLGSHPGAGWQIGGVGDFNNDGTQDVFWFNPSSGQTDIWELSNGHWAASVSPGSHPTGYQVAGIGDFNGDGTSDVLWFNPTTRDTELWLISNGHWGGSIDLGAHPGSATIAGVGDFNGGGTSDVLWHQFV